MAGPLRWRGRRGSGQSLVEFALVSPILFLLLVGILEAMLLLFGISTAHYAAGRAAVVVAEVGNDPSADDAALAAIRATAIGTTSIVNVTEVDIYKVDPQTGAIATTCGGPCINRYQLDGTSIGTPDWLPLVRDVTLSSGDYIGISIQYVYDWKSGIFGGFLPPVQQTAVDQLRIEPKTY